MMMMNNNSNGSGGSSNASYDVSAADGNNSEAERSNEDLAQEFQIRLRDLKFNDAIVINKLMHFARDHIKAANEIAPLVENRILESTNPKQRLAVLYVLDSITKNVGKIYKTLFSQNIVSVFCTTFEMVDDSIRTSLVHLYNTWVNGNIFEQTSLKQMEDRFGAEEFQRITLLRKQMLEAKKPAQQRPAISANASVSQPNTAASQQNRQQQQMTSNQQQPQPQPQPSSNQMTQQQLQFQQQQQLLQQQNRLLQQFQQQQQQQQMMRQNQFSNDPRVNKGSAPNNPQNQPQPQPQPQQDMLQDNFNQGFFNNMMNLNQQQQMMMMNNNPMMMNNNVNNNPMNNINNPGNYLNTFNNNNLMQMMMMFNRQQQQQQPGQMINSNNPMMNNIMLGQQQPPFMDNSNNINNLMGGVNQPQPSQSQLSDGQQRTPQSQPLPPHINQEASQQQSLINQDQIQLASILEKIGQYLKLYQDNEDFLKLQIEIKTSLYSRPYNQSHFASLKQQYTNLCQKYHVTSSDVTPPPPKEDFDPADLLYRSMPLQCKHCALRFKEGDQLRKHIDWHYRVNKKDRTNSNKKEKEKTKQAMSRSWFVTEDDWMSAIGGSHEHQAEQPALAYFSKSQKKEELDKPLPNLIADDSQPNCPICREKFDKFWDEANEEWMYRAVELNESLGKIVHFKCNKSSFSDDDDEDEDEEDEEYNNNDNNTIGNVEIDIANKNDESDHMKKRNIQQSIATDDNEALLSTSSTNATGTQSELADHKKAKLT